MTDRPGIVYLAVNKESGKAYVGQTKIRFQSRIGNHLSVALTKNSTTPFHRALRKYGFPGFDFAILETCDPATLDERESDWIKRLCCKTPHGYNRTDGGRGTNGCEYTDERRDKIRISKLGDRNPMKNPETAKKHGLAIRGERNTLFGKFGAQHPRFGARYKLSDEHRKKRKEIANRTDIRDGSSRRMLARQAELNTPEMKAKRAEGLRRYWNSEEGKKKRSAMTKAAWTDERRERQVNSLRAAWERRKGQPSPLKGRPISEQHRKAVADGVRLAMQRPEVIAAMRKPRSVEGCKNISIAKKGRPWTAAQRIARDNYYLNKKVK